MILTQSQALEYLEGRAEIDPRAAAELERQRAFKSRGLQTLGYDLAAAMMAHKPSASTRTVQVIKPLLELPQAPFEPRTIKLVFHGVVPTVNHLHNPRIVTAKGGKQFVTMQLSAEGRKFKKTCMTQFAQQLKRSGYQKPDGITFWYLHIIIIKPWLNLDNTVKEEDASNRIKALEDAVKEATGIDDRYFWVCQIEKEHSRENPRAIVKLEEMHVSEVMR